MAVHVNDGVFHLHHAHGSLEVSAGSWEGAGLFILCSPGDREGRGWFLPSLSEKAAPCCSSNPCLILFYSLPLRTFLG